MITAELNREKKLVSIITASNRPHNMKAFLENLKETVANYDVIEVLAKIDDGDDVMLALMKEAVEKFPFEIRYIQTPRLNGYYTLHHGYQQLFEMSNPESYFIFPVNEEVRFKTKAWDEVLAKYIGFYDDHLFRLKISRLKHRNYYSIYECGPTPENYPFATRKWMELAGGIGDCWGPDGWHQYIDFHLGQTEGINGLSGIFRSIPLLDIEISGEEAGKELSAEQIRVRSHKIYQEWWRMYSTRLQQEFRRIASRMFAHIWAENQNTKKFYIEENKSERCFLVRNSECNTVEKRIDYHLSAAYIRLSNFQYLIKMARKNSIGSLTAFIYPSYVSEKPYIKYTQRLVRYLLTLSAVALSLITIDDESTPRSALLRQYYRSREIFKYFKRKLSQRDLAKPKEPDSHLDDPFLKFIRRVIRLTTRILKLVTLPFVWAYKALMIGQILNFMMRCFRFALSCLLLKMNIPRFERGVILFLNVTTTSISRMINITIRIIKLTARIISGLKRVATKILRKIPRFAIGIKNRVYYPNPLKRGE